jgi:hypothetical protein
VQTTSHILLIRPVNFAFNPQTAVNNSFQAPERESFVQQKALQEFDTFVRILANEGVQVAVVNDTPEDPTPDACRKPAKGKKTRCAGFSSGPFSG